MSDFPKNANGIIREIDRGDEIGAYYQVRFSWLPRVGDLIDLTSFVDIAEKRPTSRYGYEVVKVIHHMHDVSDKIKQATEGHHSVSVVVKPSSDKLLE